MNVAIVSPGPGEASDGRIVLVAPEQVRRVRLSLDGEPASVRILARRDGDGGVRFELQTGAVDRDGAGLELEALDAGGASLGRAQVADIHLLGRAAFGPVKALRRDGAAAAQALGITRSVAPPVGISAACLGSGRFAEAGAKRSTLAGSTLKVAILLAAFADDEGNPTRRAVSAAHRRAIVDSDNEAANQVLVTVGGGSAAAGTRRVNELMARIGLRQSVLDGPYVVTSGRSRKTTSASDLRLLVSALHQTARDGTGRLGDLGVSRREARVLVGLMAATTYPGLVREHVPGPVAHKAGWLDDQQNDAAIVFGGRGGPCVVGITTEGLSFGAADALGGRLAKEVLPLLRRPA